MVVKFTIEGAEETIKLLDIASSLIGELRAVVLELRGNIPDYPSSDFVKEPIEEKVSQRYPDTDFPYKRV